MAKDFLRVSFLCPYWNPSPQPCQCQSLSDFTASIPNRTCPDPAWGKGREYGCPWRQPSTHPLKKKKKSHFSREKWKLLLDLSSATCGQQTENSHKNLPHKILLAHCSATKRQTPLNFAWQNTYYCSDNRSDKERICNHKYPSGSHSCKKRKHN